MDKRPASTMEEKTVEVVAPAAKRKPRKELEHLRDTHGLFIVVEANIGAGKCLHPDTEVLLYNGKLKRAEHVVPGDRLMGPDSEPREVLSISRGVGEMFEIRPKRAPSWICNDVHVLTLVDSLTDEVIDIPLNEFLKKPKTWRERQKLFATGVSFPETTRQLEIDPYILGLWLGDGRKDLNQGFQFTFPDDELVCALREFADAWGLRVAEYSYPGKCSTWAIVGDPGPGANRALNTMRKLMEDGIGIPHHFKTASFTSRAALLAGLLDTDGYSHRTSYEIVQKFERLADDITFLARSLGLRVVRTIKRVKGYKQVYHRMSISGDMTFLPVRVMRKKPKPRRQKKHHLRFGFSVEALGKGDYAGFTLNGDGRFLLGNFQVTHNTEFCHMLGRVKEAYDGPTKVLFEPVAKPRFKRLLGRFYQDPGRWGFAFQMYALNERFKQHTLASELTSAGQHVVQDRSIYADGCFGTAVYEDGNMDDDEWGIYAETFGSMKRFLRYPDVLVYLRTDPKVCHERMQRRARSEEGGVPLEYLRRIHEKHESFVEEMSRFTRVLRIDWNHFGSDVEAINERINAVADEDHRFLRDFRRL